MESEFSADPNSDIECGVGFNLDDDHERGECSHPCVN